MDIVGGKQLGLETKLMQKFSSNGYLCLSPDVGRAPLLLLIATMGDWVLLEY